MTHIKLVIFGSNSGKSGRAVWPRYDTKRVTRLGGMKMGRRRQI